MTGLQSLKASPSQSATREKKKKILQNIEKTLLERQRVRDEETDRLRSNGGSLKFLYKSTRATLKEEAVKVCGWKRRDTLQACQQPIKYRRRRCHKHSQVHGNVTVRCPHCAEISLENSFKTAHLTHCHHMNGDKNPILIPKPEYTLAYRSSQTPQLR